MARWVPVASITASVSAVLLVGGLGGAAPQSVRRFGMVIQVVFATASRWPELV